MMKWVQHIVIFSCLLLIAAFIPVRTEHGYFCDYTGSFKEWNTWFWLVETDQHYRKSKLEEFLENKHASELEHKWVSFRGTTTYLLAGSMFAHGSPNPLFQMPRDLFDQWCDAVSDEEKMKLYNILKAGDKKDIRAKAGEMEEFILTQLRLPLK